MEKILIFADITLLLLLHFIFFASLLDWWGLFWFSVVWAIPVLLIGVTTVFYRLTTGSWTTIFLVLLGTLSGCTGLLVLAPTLLAFPIIYRLVEGAWPVTYLALYGALVVIGVITTLLERSKKSSNGIDQLKSTDSS